MPFTFSHPALLLPLAKLNPKHYSITGLVVGCIVPDFEYFFLMKKGHSQFSHTFSGILYFNLPLGVLLAFVFHWFIKRPLASHLPAPLSGRLHRYTHLDWLQYFRKRWWLVAVCIVIGALSHFAWDELTHLCVDLVYQRVRGSSLPALLQHHNSVYTFIHVLFSLIGLAAIAAFVWKLPQKVTEPNRYAFRYWMLVFLSSTVVSAVRTMAGDDLLFKDLVATAVSAFLLAITLVSAVVTFPSTGRAGKVF